jgi:hypothetical protein
VLQGSQDAASKLVARRIQLNIVLTLALHVSKGFVDGVGV